MLPDDTGLSGEKTFTVDAKVNRRNNRWLAHDPEVVLILARTKFLANVYMLDVAFNEVDVMPTLMPRENVTNNIYLGVLTNVVKPWMETYIIWKTVRLQAGRCARRHKSFGAKLLV